MDAALRRIKPRPLGYKTPPGGPVEHWVEHDRALDDATQAVVARAHVHWDEVRERMDLSSDSQAQTPSRRRIEGGPGRSSRKPVALLVATGAFAACLLIWNRERSRA
jgi:hypothetical protein